MTAPPESIRAQGALPSPAAAELLAKLIVLVAALLPAAAVAIRLIGFILDPYLRNTVQLAVAWPISDLTALGAVNLFGPVIAILVTAVFARQWARDRGWWQHLSSESQALAGEYQAVKADLEDLEARWQTRQSDLAESGTAPPEDATSEDFDARLQRLLAREQELSPRYEAWHTASQRPDPYWIRPFFWLFGRVDRLAGPLVKHVTKHIGRKAWIMALLLILAAFAALVPGFPTAWILLPTSFGGQMLIYRDTNAAGDFLLRHAWPGVALFIAGYVLTAGLTYSGPGPATYHFAPTAGVHDGSYAELGRTDDLVYLRPCANLAAGSVAVPPAAIVLVELPPPPTATRRLSPSLIDLLRGNRTLTLGTSAQCEGR